MKKILAIDEDGNWVHVPVYKGFFCLLKEHKKCDGCDCLCHAKTSQETRS